MDPDDLISKLDADRIAEAIGVAEKKTSGEIRVCVSHRRRDDALDAARRRFYKLKMDHTRHRNAVLIFFVPHTHQFALWGDTEVHQRCGDAFWQGIAAEMTPLLREDRFTDAVLLAVQKVGEVLARHFPPLPDDQDELPNQIVSDS